MPAELTFFILNLNYPVVPGSICEPQKSTKEVEVSLIIMLSFLQALAWALLQPNTNTAGQEGKGEQTPPEFMFFKDHGSSYADSSLLQFCKLLKMEPPLRSGLLFLLLFIAIVHFYLISDS